MLKFRGERQSGILFGDLNRFTLTLEQVLYPCSAPRDGRPPSRRSEGRPLQARREIHGAVAPRNEEDGQLHDRNDAFLPAHGRYVSLTPSHHRIEFRPYQVPFQPRANAKSSNPSPSPPANSSRPAQSSSAPSTPSATTLTSSSRPKSSIPSASTRSGRGAKSLVISLIHLSSPTRPTASSSA